MNKSVIKFALRTLGTIFAIFGLSMLAFGLFLFLPESLKSGQVFVVFFSLFGILLGAGLLYAGFIIWFRFSKSAVQQTLGIFAFYAFGALCSIWTKHYSFDISSTSSSLFFLMSGIAIYALYRVTLSYFNSRLFSPLLKDAEQGAAANP